MNAFRILRKKVSDGIQGGGPSLTRIKRFYKKVEIIEHPIMSSDNESIRYLDKNEQIGLDNL
jgi:hypothetical protein